MTIEIIPKELRTETVQAVLDASENKTPMPLTARYGKNAEQSPDEEIEYDVIHGDPGMAPVISRGTRSPLTKGGGESKIRQHGYLISEKMQTTEEEVCKLLEAPTRKKKAYMVKMANKMLNLLTRNRVTLEWLISQIFFNLGRLEYSDGRGAPFTIDYKVPADLKELLTGDLVWGTGANRAPVKDIRTIMDRVKRRCGSPVTDLYVNSKTVTERFSDDRELQALLAQSNHPIGVNLITDPAGVIQKLFNIPNVVVYDESRPLALTIVDQPAADKLVIREASQLDVGAELSVLTGDSEQAATKDIMKVGEINGTLVTLEEAVATDYTPGIDIVQASIPFLKDDRLVFVAGKVKGEQLVKLHDAPVGMKAQYGEIGKSWPIEDPDLLYTRIQRLCLWALRNTGAIGTLDVA